MGQDIYITEGEANVTKTWTLDDDDDLPVDLSDPGWSAKIYASKKNQTVVIVDGEAMDIVPDQVNYKGQVRFMFTNAMVAGKRGTYEYSVMIEHSDGRKHEYPKKKDESFGKLVIQRSKTNS